MCVSSPQRGSLSYQRMTVLEESPPGTIVGNVTRAVDADEGANAIVYYFIAGKVQNVGKVSMLLEFFQISTTNISFNRVEWTNQNEMKWKKRCFFFF